MRCAVPGRLFSSSLAQLLLWSALAGGCQRDTSLVDTRQPDAQAPGEDAAGPASDAQISLPDAGLAQCGNHVCACSNGGDDDGDNKIDGFDGECTGAYDDDERTFATGTVSTGNPQCVDCFFDGNPGADDKCRVAASCGQTGSSEGAPAACNTCSPGDECKERCLPRTPNGCDCFGCCVVETGTGSLQVQLTDTCSLDVVNDPTKCPTCHLNDACLNPCGRCELCPGQTLTDLPADCQGQACEGTTTCSATRPCSNGNYCSQGCCVTVI
jgi:hypothetical protein